MRIISISYLPLAASTICATLMRCLDTAKYPLYASIISVILNTLLNYILIFGKAGMPEMGVKGAAVATVVSQSASFILTLYFDIKVMLIFIM
ncbi:MAG: hypothetical protein HFH66_03345 [Lachnospiraceae bacterium]|nr:hypothetical protein [Lachnospiraceae bacterium]